MTTDKLRRTLVRAAEDRCAELGKPFTEEMRREVNAAIDRYLQQAAKDYERVS